MQKPSPEAATPAVPMIVLLAALVPFGLGYLLSYLFRAANAVTAPDLVRDLGLTASDLGMLTAAYLFAFALFQLPLGILLDRFGPRRVQTGLLLLAACGAALFASGQSALHLAIARAVIGMGVAGGLMASFKAVVMWVPEVRRPLANSCVMSLGAVGLLISTTPFEWALQLAGWRGVFLVLAGITAVVALTILLVVPEKPIAASGDTLGQQIGALVGIYRDRAFWALAPLLASTAGTHIAYQTLWAGPWFRDVAGLDRAGVATHLFAMAAAFFFGILFSGVVADFFVRRGASVLSVMFGFCLFYLAGQALFVLPVPYSLQVVGWMIFGMSGQVAILAYPWLASYFGAKLSGRANTAMNLLIFMTAFLVQSAVGWIIDLYPRTATGGYANEAYTAAFGLFLVVQLAALAGYLARWRVFHPAKG